MIHVEFNIYKVLAEGEKLEIHFLDYSITEYKIADNPIELHRDRPNSFDWKGSIEIDCLTSNSNREDLCCLKYTYKVRKEENLVDSESCRTHEIMFSTNSSRIFVKDDWYYSNPLDHLNNKLFRVISKGEQRPQYHISRSPNHLFFILPKLSTVANSSIYLVGNKPELGEWDPKRGVAFKEYGNFLIAEIPCNHLKPFEYKLILKSITDEVIWENLDGNRIFSIESEKSYDLKLVSLFYPKFDAYIYPRLAGTSIPVFSLRSKSSEGIGDFLDILPTCDWLKSSGQNILQLLPIYDTNFVDLSDNSYPYSCISSFALNPIYLNLKEFMEHNSLDVKMFSNQFKNLDKLNSLSSIDYPAVLKNKLAIFKESFSMLWGSNNILNNKNYKAFYLQFKNELIEYALFKIYANSNNYPTDIEQWEDYSSYKDKTLKKGQTFHVLPPKIHYYTFLQYELYRQFQIAKTYAETNNIAIKGDLPIGISRLSVDSWVRPHLVNLKYSAGSPPDFFATKGQNWGFPTYNWTNIKQENYKWWTKRFQHMEILFDAIRIDHILGFFRIWSVPTFTRNACYGFFEPSIPYTLDDLTKYFNTEEINQFCKPYIKKEIARKIFGKKVLDELSKNRLIKEFEDAYHISSPKESLTCYHLSPEAINCFEDIRGEVFFIRTDDQKNFYPRVLPQLTMRFKCLPWPSQQKLIELHEHFFHEKNEMLWYRTALERLDQVSKSTQMLLCGEDLGFLPKTVHWVLKKYGILSLELPRMSKNPETKFLRLQDIPYSSVLTTGTHDMPSFRKWWNDLSENEKVEIKNNLSSTSSKYLFDSKTDTQTFFLDLSLCNTFALIIPLQDWFALNNKYNYIPAENEQINFPENPNHKWDYRIPENIELVGEDIDLTKKISNLCNIRGYSKVNF